MSQTPPPSDAGGQGQPHGEPQPEQPSHSQPYQQPGYQQPTYQQPGYQQPTYRQPAYPQPTYQQPTYEQGYQQPGYPAQQGYQAYPQYAGAPSRPNNTMAVVSLIAGIVGLFMIPIVGSVVAIITGGMARKQIAQTGEEGSGLATAGIVMGWIGAVLWGLLILLWIGIMVMGFGMFAGMSGY